MTDMALKLAPILLAFIAGVVLRRLAGFTPQHADRMLRLVVWVGLPGLIIASIAQIHLRYDLLQLPLFPFAVAAIVWPVAASLAARLKLSRRQAGVYVTGVLMMNLAFEYPFILALFGQEGFAYLALVSSSSCWRAFCPSGTAVKRRMSPACCLPCCYSRRWWRCFLPSS
jgi:predicted permease